MRLDSALDDTRRQLVARDTSDWRRLEQLVIESCHRKQRWFVEDSHRRVAGLCGRGAGKTTAGKARLALRMLRTQNARCLYIALTREHAEVLMWGPLKQLFEDLGFVAGVDVIYNETKLLARLVKNGATVRLVGADNERDIDKLRGQPFHEVGIDEAASFPAKLLTNLIERIIGPRLGDYGGMMWLIGTPGHLLHGPFYEATRAGGDRHRPYTERDQEAFEGWTSWSSHSWSLQDGAKSVQALANNWAEALIEKADKQWGDDHPVWMREWLGLWAADDTENIFKYRPHVDGVEWNRWDPERLGSMRVAKLPDAFKDWIYVVALDEGVSDPFACNAFAFSPSDTSRMVYHVYSFEQRTMYAQPTARLLLGDALSTSNPGGLFGQIGWPAGIIIDGGNSYLEELANVYGIRAVQSDRGLKYKFAAIEVVNGDLVEGRMKILKDSPLETQIAGLQWVLNEFGHRQENKANANHSSDTLILGRLVIGQMLSANGAWRVAIGSKPAYSDPQGLDEAGPRNGVADSEGLLSSGTFDEIWGG